MAIKAELRISPAELLDIQSTGFPAERMFYVSTGRPVWTERPGDVRARIDMFNDDGKKVVAVCCDHIDVLIEGVTSGGKLYEPELAEFGRILQRRIHEAIIPVTGAEMTVTDLMPHDDRPETQTIFRIHWRRASIADKRTTSVLLFLQQAKLAFNELAEFRFGKTTAHKAALAA